VPTDWMWVRRLMKRFFSILGRELVRRGKLSLHKNPVTSELGLIVLWPRRRQLGVRTRREGRGATRVQRSGAWRH
jgi:hypothetical protein